MYMVYPNILALLCIIYFSIGSTTSLSSINARQSFPVEKHKATDSTYKSIIKTQASIITHSIRFTQVNWQPNILTSAAKLSIYYNKVETFKNSFRLIG